MISKIPAIIRASSQSRVTSARAHQFGGESERCEVEVGNIELTGVPRWPKSGLLHATVLGAFIA